MGTGYHTAWEFLRKRLLEGVPKTLLLWQVLRPTEEPSFCGKDNEERTSQVMVTTQKMSLWCGNNHVNQSLGVRTRPGP